MSCSRRFAALFCFLSLSQPSAAAPELLSDTDGRISTVVLSVNSARRAALRNADLVTQIVNGLPRRVDVDILSNDRSAFIARNPNPERVRFLDLPDSKPVTIWTQDPFLVLHDVDDGITTLLASREFERADDYQMAQKIAEANGFETRVSKLYFEGGNIVADGQTIFIGANTIRYNAQQLGISEIDVVLSFEAELGRKVLVIGPVPQPVAHIDMMLTPLGNGRIAIADAGWGARIARQALQQDPDSVDAFERFCHEYFFGHPSIRSIRRRDGEQITAPDMHGRTATAVAASQNIASLLDGIAGSLEAHGYRVERVPLLFGGPELRDDLSSAEGSVADFPMLTYNNVLLETGEHRNSVYLPAYGWSAMDDAAQAAWQSMGYSVKRIDGLTFSSMYGGALRCSVKVLERK